MNEEERFNNRYKEGDIPWDIGRPDYNLINVVIDTPILPCKALDIGCGTGDSSIWLAENGFKVTGTDTVELAVEMAGEKASESGVEVTFLKSDILKDRLPEHSFDFVYDRGCFHTFDLKSERKKFAKNVAKAMEEGGLWLSLIGSQDSPPRDEGPPQRSANDIVEAVEPYFEIISMVAGFFDSDREVPNRAWICLFRKRK